jgi:hypothetical protein
MSNAADPDCFILDCEGFVDLNVTTTPLCPIIIALSSIATIKLITMQGKIDRDNWPYVQDLIVAGRALTGPMPGWARSTIVLERDIGVSNQMGTSYEDRNEYRKKQDALRSQDMIDALRTDDEDSPGARLIDREGKVLVFMQQPDVRDKKLYKANIRDVVRTIDRIANRRKVIRGDELFKTFKGMKECIVCRVSRGIDELRIVQTILDEEADRKALTAGVGAGAGVVVIGAGTGAVILAGIKTATVLVFFSCGVGVILVVTLAVVAGAAVKHHVNKRVHKSLEDVVPDPDR